MAPGGPLLDDGIGRYQSRMIKQILRSAVILSAGGAKDLPFTMPRA